MCGIAGFVGAGDRETLARMTARLVHRGPDDSGLWSDGPVFLGHRFQTDHSDSEVLLHGYREWGADLPNRLNGMWAFALHDRKNARLFCSRDRFGKKPFYYSAGPAYFVFGS